MTNANKFKYELAKLLASIDNSKLVDDFLNDLLSPKEYSDIAKRLQIVKQLEAGIPQREVADNLGVGVATVTRGSHELKDERGGFRKVLDKYYKL